MSDLKKAKQLLDEWIEQEHIIDIARCGVITDLHKKINEIQRAREEARTRIKKAQDLYILQLYTTQKHAGTGVNPNEIKQ